MTLLSCYSTSPLVVSTFFRPICRQLPFLSYFPLQLSPPFFFFFYISIDVEVLVGDAN